MIVVQRNEWLPALLGFLWFFLVMFSYQLLRPIRESLVSELPSHEKNWLFLATFAVMLLAVPVYGNLVSILRRRQLILLLFGVFTGSILCFAAWYSLASGEPSSKVWMIRCYFVWVSVFSLYVTSIVWSVLIDLFSEEQGKRLFGLIASGATMGAIGGSTVALMSGDLGNRSIMLIAASALAASATLAIGLERATANWTSGTKPQPMQGGMLEGIKEIGRQSYLMLIIGYIAFISFFGMMIYMQLTDVAKLEIVDPSQRTAFFARLNLYVQLGTWIAQFVFVGPIMRWLGVSWALMILPCLAGVCFTFLSQQSGLQAIGLVDVICRIGTYGFSVPAREVLFTVVNRESKYKAKNVIDTIFIRGADTLASTIIGNLKLLVSFSAICLLTLPLVALWVWTTRILGQKHTRMLPKVGD